MFELYYRITSTHRVAPNLPCFDGHAHGSCRQSVYGEIGGGDGTAYCAPVDARANAGSSYGRRALG